jgi:ATP-dependent DNA ligase
VYSGPAGGSKGKSAEDKPDSLSDKETLDCWVYGYTANAEGEVRSLLLATKSKSGALKFYQKLALDSLGDEELKKLNDDLKPFRTRSSAIKSPYVGKWVKPIVGCRVAHDGMNTEERPTNPVFHSLILP